jgi:HlyD family secretion protein
VRSLIKNAIKLVVVGGLLAVLVYSFRPQPVPVDVAVVTTGPLELTVDEDGKTRVKDRFIVSAPLAGQMKRIELKAGDPVPNDGVLTEIEPTDPALLDPRTVAEIAARVQAADARVKKAHIDRQRARVAAEHAVDVHERLKRLGEAGASTDELRAAAMRERTTAEELRSAESGVDVAVHELAQARAALVRTTPPSSPEEARDWQMKVRSPVRPAKVLRVHQESACVVTPGLKLIEVGDPASIEVEIDLLSSDAVKVKKGDPVFIEHWGGSKPLKGEVRVIEPSGFLKVSALGVEEQRVYVLIDFKSPRSEWERLGDGYRVEARIVVWDGANLLKAPAGALFRHGDGWAVFREARGRAALRVIQVGRSNGLETEVTGGLGEGDSVILHPSDRIKDGVAVTPRPGR